MTIFKKRRYSVLTLGLLVLFIGYYGYIAIIEMNFHTDNSVPVLVSDFEIGDPAICFKQLHNPIIGLSLYAKYYARDSSRILEIINPKVLNRIQLHEDDFNCIFNIIEANPIYCSSSMISSDGIIEEIPILWQISNVDVTMLDELDAITCCLASEIKFLNYAVDNQWINNKQRKTIFLNLLKDPILLSNMSDERLLVQVNTDYFVSTDFVTSIKVEDNQNEATVEIIDDNLNYLISNNNR